MDLFPQHNELIWAIRRGELNTAKLLLDGIAGWAQNLNLDRAFLYTDYIECAIDFNNIHALILILRILKQQGGNCASHLLFSPSDYSFNFIERALWREHKECAKLLVYFSSNCKQKNILSTLDRLSKLAKVDITPSDEDWHKYIDAMIQKRKNSHPDLLSQSQPKSYIAKEFKKDIYRLYSLAYQNGVLTFKLMKCNLTSAYAFLYKIETQTEECLKPKLIRNTKKEKKLVYFITSDTTFPIDALPADLINLVIKELQPRDILSLFFVNKGTLKMLDHLDNHYHIWKSLYASQKYVVANDEKSEKELNWRKQLIKTDKILSNWSEGKYTVNYLTRVNGMPIYLADSNDDWMLFRGLANNSSCIALWNCEDQRMWSNDFRIRHAMSPIFINAGNKHNPPTIVAGIGIPHKILFLRNFEQSFLEFKVPTHSGLADIFCSVENKLYSQCGYLDMNSEVFVDYAVRLDLTCIRPNIFNERIMYGRNRNNAWQLMDARDDMNIIQKLELDSVTFVDEYKFLNHITNITFVPKLQLYDIRKFDPNTVLAEKNVFSTKVPMVIDLKTYRVVEQHGHYVYTYRTNTLERLSEWTYENELKALNGRYAIASAFGRVVALDFATI